MASKIKGITIEIGGDTKPLEKALSGVNKTSRNLQSELREVEQLLKLDPGNTELLAQKMKLLQEQTSNTAEKLKKLEEAQEQVNQQFREGKINDQQYRAFNREIEQTRIQLRQLEEAADESAAEIEDLGQASEKSEGKLSKLGSMAGNAAKSIGGMAVKGTAAALTGIATAAAGIGVAAVKSADDAQKALNSLQVQTGATDSEMKSLEEGMVNIYRNNFGENFEDIANSMATIAQQTNMTGELVGVKSLVSAVEALIQLAVLAVAQEGVACVSKLGTDLVSTAGNQLAFHKGKSLFRGQHPVIGLAAFGAGLGGIGNKHPVLLGILKKITLQAALGRLGGTFHNGKIALIHFPVFDLLIHDPQGLRRFGGDDDTTGVTVDAVAQGGGKGIFLPGTPFPFLIQIRLDMIDKRPSILRTIVGMNRQPRTLIHQQDVFILVDNVQLGSRHRQVSIVLPGLIEELIINI